MDSSYSNAIIAGLKKSGFDSRQLARATGIPANRIAAIIADQGEFTDREVALIERWTKLTGGQLAARSIEPAGGALTNLMNEWAILASLDTEAKSEKSSSTRSSRNKNKTLPRRPKKAVAIGK